MALINKLEYMKESAQTSSVFVNIASCTLNFVDGKQVIIASDGKNNLIVSVLQDESDKIEIKKSVLKHYKKAKSISQLAEMCGYSCTKTFTRHFQSSLNTTPKQWILALKEKEMIRYLKDTDYSLKQIAVLLNFSNQSQLSHFCILRTGFTPKELRESK